MTTLKTILKHHINHCDENDLPSRLCSTLIDYSPSSMSWYYEGSSLNVTVKLENQNEALDFIEDLVGCSYITNQPQAGLLTLSFTVSTLIEKLNGNEQDTVKMDRFAKYTPSIDECVHIVDNKLLLNELERPHRNGAVIFSACTSSEWVNNCIVDEVLKIINTNNEYVKLMDITKENEK